MEPPQPRRSRRYRAGRAMFAVISRPEALPRSPSGAGLPGPSAAAWGEPGAASPCGAAGAGYCPGDRAGGPAATGGPLLAVSAPRSLPALSP